MADMLAQIRERRRQLAEEDRELAAAEAVITRLANGKAASVGLPRSARECVVALLASGDRLDSAAIIAGAKKRWGIVIKPLSLRPLLTNMKNEGLIQREGRKVFMR